MSRHAAPRNGWFGGRWFGHGRTRALLTLGLVLSLGVVGTSAYWTDTATITGGTITAGSLDLQLQTHTNGATWLLVDPDVTAADPQLTISNLAPGETYAFNMAARNMGSISFDYLATVSRGSSPVWTFVDGANGSPITVRFHEGGRRADDPDPAYPVNETCSGTAVTAAVRVGASAANVVPSRHLGPGEAGEQWCVLVSMHTDAVNENQGKAGSLVFNFDATQSST